MCFKMKMPQVKMPTVTTTARDLLPQAESKEPESPLFGDEEDTNFTDIAKRKGISALKITPTTTSNYNPVNSYFDRKGSV